MEFFKNILKGMVIGLANIIPGVSGGTMMVSMNIYDKLIHCITHLFKELKESIIFLIPIVIGMLVAIVGSSYGIEALFTSFPCQTNLLFIGLIFGGMPVMIKRMKETGKKISIGNGVIFLVFLAVVIGLALTNGADNTANLSVSFGGIIILFIVGVIAAATMVIPGVSGSMVLLLLGYYRPILGAITEFIDALRGKNMGSLIHGFGILFPFGLGVLFGIFAIAKLVEVVFEKFPMYAYSAIMGLIVASPVAIILLNPVASVSVGGIVVSIITLAAGFYIAMKLGE